MVITLKDQSPKWGFGPRVLPVTYVPRQDEGQWVSVYRVRGSYLFICLMARRIEIKLWMSVVTILAPAAAGKNIRNAA